MIIVLPCWLDQNECRTSQPANRLSVWVIPRFGGFRIVESKPRGNNPYGEPDCRLRISSPSLMYSNASRSSSVSWRLKCRSLAVFWNLKCFLLLSKRYSLNRVFRRLRGVTWIFRRLRRIVIWSLLFQFQRSLQFCFLLHATELRGDDWQ